MIFARAGYVICIFYELSIVRFANGASLHRSCVFASLRWVFYFAFTRAMVVSSMRLENPHSLSYHANTLTNLPSITFVRPAS